MTRVALVAVALVLAKTALLEWLRVGGMLPDLFLALVVSASLARGPRVGLAAGGLVGLVLELSSVEGHGLYPLLYGAAGWGAGLVWERVIRRSPASEFLFLAGLGLLLDGVLLAAESGLSPDLPVAILGAALPSAVATGLVGLLAVSALGPRLFPLATTAPSHARGQRR